MQVLAKIMEKLWWLSLLAVIWFELETVRAVAFGRWIWIGRLALVVSALVAGNTVVCSGVAPRLGQVPV